MILEIEIPDEIFERVKNINVDLGDNIFGELVRSVQKGTVINLPFTVGEEE